MKKYLTALILICLFSSGISLAASSGDVPKAYSDSYRFEKMGAYQDAIKAIMPLYRRHPDQYLLNLRLGWLYYLAGRNGDSTVYYRRAVKILPGSIEARLGLSLPLMAKADWSGVEELMYQVIRSDHYNFYGNLRLAKALRLQKKPSLAEKVTRKMLDLYPSSVDFLVELGADLTAQGKKQKAIQIFNTVLLLDPQNVAAREYKRIIARPAEAGHR